MHHAVLVLLCSFATARNTWSHSTKNTMLGLTLYSNRVCDSMLLLTGTPCIGGDMFDQTNTALPRNFLLLIQRSQFLCSKPHPTQHQGLQLQNQSLVITRHTSWARAHFDSPPLPNLMVLDIDFMEVSIVHTSCIQPSRPRAPTSTDSC